jgi:hypothetical protein
LTYDLFGINLKKQRYKENKMDKEKKIPVCGREGRLDPPCISSKNPKRSVKL